MASIPFRTSLVEASGLTESGNLDFTAITRILRAIETRLSPLEAQSGSLDAAIEAVRKVGLDRINQVLVPAIQLILDIQSKGYLIANSSTSAILANGNILTLTIGNLDQRRLFTPSPFVALTRVATPDDYAILRTIAYTPDDGKYIGEVLSFEGAAGPHSDWVLGALAGSTIAQLSMLNEVRSKFAQINSAVASTNEDRLDVTAKAAAVGTKYEQIGGYVTDFAKRYLGVYSSNPTTDPFGGELQVGALAFILNTGAGVAEMRVYKGASQWVAAGSVVNGTAIRRKFTATAGQTIFSLGTDRYDPGFVDVYHNGAQLIPDEDFTASTGTTIVLTSPAQAGDRVAVIAYGAFEVANVATPSLVTAAVSDEATARAAADAALQDSLTTGLALKVHKLVWEAQPGSFTAVAGKVYTVAAGSTVTFPASPTAGNRIGISTESTVEAAPVTINLNGQSFDASTANIVVAQGMTLIFEFFNSAWRLAA